MQPEQAVVERTPYQILKASLDKLKHLKNIRRGLSDRKNTRKFRTGVLASIFDQFRAEEEELRPVLIVRPGDEARRIWSVEPERENQREFQRHVHSILFISDSVQKWLLDEEVLTSFRNPRDEANQLGVDIAQLIGFSHELLDFLSGRNPLNEARSDHNNNMIGVALSSDSSRLWQYQKALKTATRLTEKRFPNAPKINFSTQLQ